MGKSPVGKTRRCQSNKTAATEILESATTKNEENISLTPDFWAVAVHREAYCDVNTSKMLQYNEDNGSIVGRT